MLLVKKNYALILYYYLIIYMYIYIDMIFKLIIIKFNKYIMHSHL